MTDQSTSRSGRLDRVVADLLGQAPEIEAAAVVSFDGLPMVSALPPGMDEDRVAAMSAALLSLGERAAEGLGRGQLSQVYIEGESGTVFLVSCDDEAVLVAVAAAGAKAGLMLYEVRRAAGAIATVLREDEPVVPQAPQLPASLTTHQMPAMPTPVTPAGPAPVTPAVPTYEPVAVPVAVPTTAAPSELAAPYTHNGTPAGGGWSSHAAPSEPTPWS